MSRFAARFLRPFLPESLRRVEDLARELERARVEGRDPRVDPDVDPLHEAIAVRSSEAARARERASAARRAADAADEYQREFLLAMSHEIRTPLNAIQGFTRVLLDGIDGPLTEEERLDVESIHEAGEHLTGLLRDFLALVADRSSRASFHEAPFSGGELLQEIGRLARGLRSETVRVVVEDAPQNVVFFADRAKIRQALVNLVSNALKFTSEGQVTIAVARAEGGRGVFVVRDTGPGMAPSSREGAPREFAQSPEESQTGRGSGLGLAIADRIVRLSHGEMRISSRRGEGTTIELELPCVDEAAGGGVR
jgi:signal transduction histidine kinase